MPIDINTADQAALDAIPGLKGHGHEIVRYREERGRFTELRQLDEVPGLSGKVCLRTPRIYAIPQHRATGYGVPPIVAKLRSCSRQLTPDLNQSILRWSSGPRKP
ncbi:helix-hairpin-helix domain-containing protein [Novosphingobium flavum]|uniref:ComEA family DNA-binding protein n=1 Tax=Novosphingobium aerophilum TaxID=2839843 RepID=UPI00163A5E22|nr:helix-hairpin-helix domain-containing protein [Novosphingobium aerophilum]MBC2662767.1 helix-hairpin-helix domain-containing protein [Novosphingobium aerophilum]